MNARPAHSTVEPLNTRLGARYRVIALADGWALVPLEPTPSRLWRHVLSEQHCDRGTTNQSSAAQRPRQSPTER